MKEERFLYRMHLFFLLLILLPINTFATECQFSDNACVSYDGCEIVDTGSIGGNDCYPCDPHYYNNSTTNSTSCISCENYDFDTINTGKQRNSTDDSRGNTECPWMCTNNWYKSGDSCVHCPTGANSPAGSDDVNDCICPDGTHLAYNNGTYSCEQCSCTPPENGSCTTTYDATSGECQTTITCNVGYYKTETSGTISCTACPRNSTTDRAGSDDISDCICNIGYYDADGSNTNNTVSCTKCPIGMTTVTLDSDDNPTDEATKGATNINQCAMNHNTEFCISTQDPNNRTPCFKLSDATKIINNRTISTATNSGN